MLSKGYAFVCRHYVAGDRVFLVAGGRSSEAACLLAGMLENVGTALYEQSSNEKNSNGWIRGFFPTVFRNTIFGPGRRLSHRLLNQYLVLPTKAKESTEQNWTDQPEFSEHSIEVDFIGLIEPVNKRPNLFQRCLNRMVEWSPGTSCSEKQKTANQIRLGSNVKYIRQSMAIDEANPRYQPVMCSGQIGSNIDQRWFIGTHKSILNGNRERKSFQWIYRCLIVRGVYLDYHHSDDAHLDSVQLSPGNSRFFPRIISTNDRLQSLDSAVVEQIQVDNCYRLGNVLSLSEKEVNGMLDLAQERDGNLREDDLDQPFHVALKPNPQSQVAGIDEVLESVNQSASVARGLYLTFLSLSAFIFLVTSSTDDLDLLLVKLITLPLFNIELDLQGFYRFAPWVYLLVHINVLIVVLLLSRKLALFQNALATLPESEARGFLGRLHVFGLLQYLSNQHEGVLRILLWFLSSVTLVWIPPLILLWIQIDSLTLQEEMIMSYFFYG